VECILRQACTEMKMTALLSCCAAIALTGCGLPSAGPTSSQIVGQAVKRGQRQFDLVEIDYNVANILATQRRPSLATAFLQGGKPPSSRIEIGDSVSVSIWQSPTASALSGGLPGTTGGGASGESSAGGMQAVVVPEQMVSSDGAISVPYAGRVQAANRTPFQVEGTIEHLLAEKFIEPQVVVTVPHGGSDLATVSGEVVNGARVVLSERGERLLDVIASAGGVKAPVYDTLVRVSRNGQTVSIPMDQLIADPDQNIYVWPDDVITLVQSPRTFSVFGATLNNTEVPFGADKLSLSQAIAKSGGLQDLRADPAGVFLLRFEPDSVVRALGQPSLPSSVPGESPVLFHLNLQDVGGYFLASRFTVRDGDIIYVANAASDALQKFFTLIGTITGPVIGGVVVSRSTNH
jgi:polysaccharide export outer membrane protein